METNKDNNFDKQKIYEKLDYMKVPVGYDKKLPWVVQQQIAATNGIHYADRIGKLKKYPIYNLPVRKVSNGIMLDIGSGWGRWLVAGAKKNYIPIGIDLRMEFCEIARKTLSDHNLFGYTIVADLKNLPFKANVFDLVWSFSVIQHTHKDRLINCLKNIHRILKPNGFTYLEFPNKQGIRNRFGPAKFSEKSKNEYNSWVVRYYTIKEYKAFFETHFKNFKYYNHSFLGIGVLKEDLNYVSFKNKILCSVSLIGSMFAHFVPGLKNFSDSIYIKSFKIEDTKPSDNSYDCIEKFLKAHKENPKNNLNILDLLICPVSGGNLELNDDGTILISKLANIGFPVKNQIPILISSEAIPL